VFHCMFYFTCDRSFSDNIMLMRSARFVQVCRTVRHTDQLINSFKVGLFNTAASGWISTIQYLKNKPKSRLLVPNKKNRSTC